MRLIRKRFYPEEEVDISSDEVVYMNNEILVTKWLPIKKREDIKWGASCVYLKKGIKISKVFDYNDRLLYTYCDIIDTHIDNDKIVTEDLLIDVIVFPDGSYKIADIDELICLRKENKISEEIVLMALERLNLLLTDLYNGFELDKVEKYLKKGVN
ncbi:protein of unknown function DUF402 [Caldicellulosiruptor saccharolyticus DSM 8903]|uniref:DUF402 domain-containing protein n=1 Tax=Caldicellulosiruptor saccharolyticus (strain ATCC 43494 / DSM 8903 / Tp8T 6331) TaxID=351627 RepID=A4XHX6_CALS8|nr:DUF402 domain-containing protein [Caldicellulosiruptor saccharolyticus]ABP66511.1 protein of unknown function DUF402 [Caldicellulosiruptor saccharolyticus DSM 8903]